MLETFLTLLLTSPLTASLISLGLICLGLAGVGKVPALDLERARALRLGLFGGVLILIALGLTWSLAFLTHPPAWRAASTEIVTVYANQGWNDTGFTLEAGNRVRVKYLAGTWTTWPERVAPFGAQGEPEPYVCAELMPAVRCAEPMPEAQKGALIARIGSADPLYVGDDVEFGARNSGGLQLSINDSKLPVDLETNEGYLVVQVTVIR